MKLGAISFSQPRQILNNNLENKNKNIQIQNKNSIPFYPTKNYLAFLGYSLDLAQTFENLKEQEYPQGIKEIIEKEIENGNIENKTLQDFHFEKYKEVLDCFTLDELKEKFPEFENVISSFDVEAQDESFIGKFQNDELDYFNSDEDLTLQLIKLYWGEGYSLNDLSDFIEKNSDDNKGLNLYYTMKKLNIPLMNSRYARVLKLSNKDYNEKLSTKMSIKHREAIEVKKQKQEGEPVIIPRGPLPQAHRDHISQGLLKYYSEHPEKITEMSARQKEFYENNPQKAKQLQEVLDYSWNKTHQGEKLKKELSKHLRKFNCTISNDVLIGKQDASKTQQKAFNEFWAIDRRKQYHSEAMKQGWEYVLFDVAKFMTDKEDGIILDTVPEKYRKDILRWAHKKGIYENGLEYGGYAKIYNSNLTMLQERKKEKFAKTITRITDRFMDEHPQQASNLANTRQIAIIKIKQDLENNSPKLPKKIREDNLLRYTLNFELEKLAYEKLYIRPNKDEIFPIDNIDNHIIHNILVEFASKCVANDCPEIEEYISRKINEVYEYVEKGEFREILMLK